MAQKAFMADAGVRLGEWSIVELANGDLQVSNMHTISGCLLYTSPSPRDRTRSRMPSSA